MDLSPPMLGLARHHRPRAKEAGDQVSSASHVDGSLTIWNAQSGHILLCNAALTGSNPACTS